MNHKPNEWVSIADLMSGVVAVVILLFVVAVLQKNFDAYKHLQEEAQRKREMLSHRDLQQEHLAGMFKELGNSLKEAQADGLVVIDSQTHKITLRDGVFNRGSACITSEAQAALERLTDRDSSFLKSFPTGRIYVEGHTDNVPVDHPVTNYAAFCTVYDDNYTLSAARAREARRLIIGTLDADTARRVIVAGYGDSQPLPNIPPEDGRQRRIEVRWVIQPDIKGQ